MYGSCKYLFNAYLDTTLRKYLYFSGQQFLCKWTKVEKPLGSHKTVLYINITDEKCIRFSMELFLCNYFFFFFFFFLLNKKYCKLYHNLPESSIQKDSDRLNARGSKMTSKFTVMASLLFFLGASIYSFFFLSRWHWCMSKYKSCFVVLILILKSQHYAFIWFIIYFILLCGSTYL